MRIRLRIKEVATERGVSQSRLSRLADIDLKTMRKFFREPYASASTLMLARIAQALDVSVSELFVEETDDDTLTAH